MGNALIIFKIFAGPEEIKKVEAALKGVKEGRLQDLKREPIAFGAEAIKAGFVIPDKVDGAMECLEEAVKKAAENCEVQVEGMTLI